MIDDSPFLPFGQAERERGLSRSASLMNVTTLHRGVAGESNTSFLVKSEGEVDNDNEHTTWVEYRCKCHDELVHRSAHVTLKKTPALFGEVGRL